jgi:diadenosine tetraphosphate (Ap4A) HIT family hydrolase/acetyltransferase-like isoleucine patch superfamily enzyme
MPTLINMGERVFMGCPFCSDGISERIFLSSRYSLAFLARHAVSEGQSLVIPKRHVTSLDALRQHEMADLMSLISSSISVLRGRGFASDFNVAINLGVGAGQSVEHLHVHLIPRISGDISDPKKWISDGLFERLEERSDECLNRLATSIRFGWAIDDRCLEDGLVFGGDLPARYRVDDDSLFFEKTAFFDDGFSDTRLGVSVGARSLIRAGTVIYSGVSVGGDFECGHNVLIGADSRLGSRVCLYSGAQVQRRVLVGDRCIVGGWLGNGAVLGNDVKMFGELVHKYDSPTRGAVEAAPLILDRAFVGWNAVIVGGVVIGQGAVVGAGSVVVSDVADEIVVAGSPAKRIGG